MSNAQAGDLIMAKKQKQISLTLTKSVHGRLEAQKACIRGLGLRRIGHCVQVEDTPSIRGMINKIGFMLRIEE